jgi:hypothetical protein
MLLLRAPRLADVLLGIFFLVINAAVYVLSYYTIPRPSDDPASRHMTFLFVLYGSIQNLIGFAGGLCLARMTEVEMEEKTVDTSDEEEMRLIVESLPA